MKSFVLAFQFLTVLPLPKVGVGAEHFGQSMMFFPLVGLFLGTILCGIHIAASGSPLTLAADLQAWLLLITLTILTRALHLDGFADTIDGLVGGRNKQDRLRIMKDSHVGVFAVVGLIFLILGKALLLTQIIERGAATAVLLIFPVVSRWGMVLFCFRARDPRANRGLARSYVATLKWPHLIVATALAFSICFLLFLKTGIWFVVLTTLIVAWVRLLALRSIGGITGDLTGATGEVIELVVLFAAHVLLEYGDAALISVA